MSTASEVDICNMALTQIGGNLITSLNDNSVEANLCRLHYPRARDVTLEAREWTFAVKRYTLSPDAEKPEFQWGNRFLIPSEVLRVLTVDRESFVSADELTSNAVEHPQIDWVREGRYILADRDVLYVRAIVRIESTGVFSEGFVHALAGRLSFDLSVPITRSRTMSDMMFGIAQQKLAEGAAMDGLQGRSKRIRSRYLSSRR